MTQPSVLHDWYALQVPAWAPVMIGVALLLVLASFAIDAWQRRRALCPVHLARGLHVTMAGTQRGAPYCPLCLFPPAAR